MNGITRLEVKDLLRVKLIEVTPSPDGSLVIVGGQNDQGKSSLLNAIALALSGKDVPAQPIRAGATEGSVILQTEEITVTRRFSGSGSTLEVRDGTGAKLPSPQAKLDALYSRVTFDPFSFVRQKAEEQLSTLKRVVGLDFTELDKEHAENYDARTGKNREAKQKEALLVTITRSPDAPAAEVSVSDLMKELEAAEKFNASNAAQRQDLSELNDAVDEAAESYAAAVKTLEDARAAVKFAEDALSQASANSQNAKRDRDNWKEVISKLEDKDTAGIREQITNADALNSKLRNNNRWNDEHKALMALQAESKKLTDRMEAIEKEKSQALEYTEFPIPGLSFGSAGVLYNNVPFDQAGTAVKIRTSIAIGRALCPKLPVMLIRDGSLLDAQSTQLIQEEADKHGLQIWVEVVGNPDDATVIIEDGRVIDEPKKRAKAQKGELL